MSNKFRIKHVSLLLAALLTASTMLSCAGETATTEETGADTTETAAVESETTEQEAREAIPDDLPTGVDLGGAEFRILTYSSTSYQPEELTGDAVNDSRYNRNMDIMDRFNAVVTAVASAGMDKMSGEIQSSVTAGDHAYDIAIPHQIYSGPGLITANLILPWNDVPYINAEKPWWNQSINKTINILGKQYYMAGYITLPTPFCMFANKGLLLDYGYDDIYSYVREGTWTFDKLSEITSKAYVDLNGNSTVEAADQFGITFNNDNTLLNFMYAAGVHSVILDETGKPVPNVYNEKMLALLDKTYSLVWNDNQTWLTTYTTQAEEGIKGFMEGRMIFFCGAVGSLDTIRDADIDLGVIPYPKWDENQDGYGTHVDASNGMLCIPMTASADDLERIGLVTEAMAAYTYKYTIPAYYDVTLGTKYIRDMESREMLDIIFDSVTYDFGYIFDHWNGCTWTLPFMVRDKKTDLASYWQGIEKKVNTHYDKLYEAVANNG